MHIPCPHCRNPIEIVRLTPREEIACPSCGSLAAPLRGTGPTPTVDGRTNTLAPASPEGTAPEVPRSFRDYEILDEIARGGMGVVYKARQVSLNREVALKMILAGQLASERDVARFRAEAEAVAALDHPNILPIYEVGEHTGRHFFAMKLIAGGSLDDRIKASRQTPRDAAQLMATVARAVHFAHQRGLLHRDLKPSNILLDEAGVPYVVDFGLAKKIEGDSALTQSGAIVGTPSYMAPEQAASQKALTAAVDIYALGAILYTLLTGRPPFRGDNLLETLRRVVEQEPVRPRLFDPQVPRDLETICLKCLTKEADRRYRSAEALAEDLERFGRGEPVVARPVGRVARLIKWARRRPAVAGLLASVLLLIAVSGGLTAYFIVKERSADAAREADKRTREADSQAREAATRIKEGEHILDLMAMPISPTDRGVLEQKLAKLAKQLSPDEAATLAEHAFDLLAGATDYRSRDGVLLMGLVRASATLAERLEPDGAARVAGHALDLMAKTTVWNAQTQGALAQAFATLAEQLEPDGAARAAEHALDLVAKTTDRNAPYYLGPAVATLTERLRPDEATRVCAKAAQPVLDWMAAKPPIHEDALKALAQAWAHLAEWLSPDEAAKAAEHTLDLMTKANDPYALKRLAEALALLAERLTAEDAARLCAKAAHPVLDRMAETTGPITLKALFRAWAKLAERLTPQEAAKATQPVLDRMANTTEPFALNALAEALAPLLERLTKEDAARVCAKAAEHAVDLMAKTTDVNAPIYLGQTVATLAGRLVPDEAARVCAKAAPPVLDLMTKPIALRDLAAQVWPQLAKRLTPDEAAKAAERALDLIDFRQFNLEEVLTPLAERLMSDEAAKAADRVLGLITKADDPNKLLPLVRGLAPLAERLGPDEAARARAKAARRILHLLTTTTNAPLEHSSLAQALTKLAQRLTPDEAGKTVEHVLDLMALTSNGNALSHLKQTVATMAECVTPDQAAKVAQKTLDLMAKTTDRFHLGLFADTLTKLAERCTERDLTQLLEHPSCVGAGRDRVQAALNKRKK
jgi:tRNA A-37 threonylcarbamoyl transferase component Bud32